MDKNVFFRDEPASKCASYLCGLATPEQGSVCEIAVPHPPGSKRQGVL
jgi:hypothetical protein